jgi:hypothetical protein
MTETQDLTWKNLSNKDREKTTGVNHQNFTISGVFTNIMGYLMMWLTLAGGLHEV